MASGQEGRKLGVFTTRRRGHVDKSKASPEDSQVKVAGLPFRGGQVGPHKIVGRLTKRRQQAKASTEKPLGKPSNSTPCMKPKRTLRLILGTLPRPEPPTARGLTYPCLGKDSQLLSTDTNPPFTLTKVKVS